VLLQPTELLAYIGVLLVYNFDGLGVSVVGAVGWRKWFCLNEQVCVV